MLTKTSRRIVALSFIAFLTFNVSGLSQTAKQPASVSSEKAADHFVLSTTLTNEKGDFITRLRRDNFQIFLDKEPVTIVDFSEGDVPLSVGIVVDVSGSLNLPGGEKTGRAVINSLQQALKGFLGLSNKSNEYFLMAFNQKPQLLLDWTSDSDALVNSINVVQPKGSTALFDACYLAIDRVQRGRYSKRVLILISDGLDNVSTYSFKQVREALKESDVQLHSVYLPGVYIPGPLGDEGEHFLEELTSLSGGVFIHGRNGRQLKASDAAWALDNIADDLTHQYSIGIQPPPSKVDGKWHKISIKLKLPDSAASLVKHMFLRTREGFYVNHR